MGLSYHTPYSYSILYLKPRTSHTVHYQIHYQLAKSQPLALAKMLFCPYCSNNLTIGQEEESNDKCWYVSSRLLPNPLILNPSPILIINIRLRCSQLNGSRLAG